jgi:cytosine/adenosine deaminase-related metal-dependent hydrolase
LNTTPKALVAAPGAGVAVCPVSVTAFLDFNSAAYDGIAAGEDLVLRYTDGSGGIAHTIEATGFLDAVADAHRISNVSGLYVPTANAALVLHMATGNIATGDSPLKIRVRYRLVTLLT